MSDLDTIVSLAELQLNYQDRVLDLEEELKEAKENLRRVSEKDLPDAMDEAGVEEFTLKDGRKVVVRKEYYANIPKAHQKVAFSWLRERGHDAIIKRDVTAKFGKGEDEKANKLVKLLKEQFDDIGFKDKESVHFQTLRAFVREQMEEGVDIPEDIFGIHVRNVAKIGIK